ncbi:MAG: hypothetical protein ACYCR5_11320 [Leptospirillum sp.]
MMLSETRIPWKGILVGGLLFGTGGVELAMAHPGVFHPPKAPSIF